MRMSSESEMIPALLTRNLNGPKLLRGLLEHRLDGGEVGDVLRPTAIASPPPLRISSRHGFGVVRVRVVVDRDPVSGRGQPQSGLAAYSP